ncbi:hypothetical protein [Spirosoma pollinicola]|uniref:Uncharacterized protein n=1 Tax=Spirosoma pollinicola TaxID=2057025 RepID=A0A2K8ZC23_9BACT|nr:hypothetical protein [Spirosoma pollinicola]AUD07421.1 hypothetical protein CWM47_22045 [Spirosoma pollinicola]
MADPSLKSTPSYRTLPGWWFWRTTLVALLLWITIDLLVPSRHSIRQFDAKEVARLETAMWRSYYDKNPALLFWQLAGGLRQQFHAPFWRSFGLAFLATKAAFAFKEGQSQADYQRALPSLITYYEAIQKLTVERFDVKKVAALELDWWIIHRQRDRYSYNDLATALEKTSAALYNQPIVQFTAYARLRADAMRLCDEAGRPPGGATEASWHAIEQKLDLAWSSLHKVVGGAD